MFGVWETNWKIRPYCNNLRKEGNKQQTLKCSDTNDVKHFLTSVSGL